MDIAAFSAGLLTRLELGPRARYTAEVVANAVPGAAVSVYLLNLQNETETWVSQASFGDVYVQEQALPINAGTLGWLAEDQSVLAFSGPELAREDYAHLDIRKTLQSLAYLPLIQNEKLAGAIEILTFDRPITSDQLTALMPVAELAGAGLLSSQNYEKERNTILTSLSRFAQLYDLEKTFASTLEMEDLLAIIGTKFSEILGCAAVNIWLLHGDESLELMHQVGDDVTVSLGTIQNANEGLAGAISETGEPIHITDPDDERLIERNRDLTEGAIESILAVPIMDKEFLVGVVEAINKYDAPFDENDLFTLTSITETAAVALHNASMLLAERKVQILETLVAVSNEITASLNLERMLQTMVNAPQAVFPYERAALALDNRGSFKLSSVTGVNQLNVDAPEIAPLNSVLQWAALAGDVLHVRQQEEAVDAPRPETRAKFEKYFAETGMRAFYAVPLNDDTGRVGILAVESSDPDFLSLAHKEVLQVLASQATVALRNAQLYREVPFISLLEPLLHRKRRFMAMRKSKRAALTMLVAAVVLFLVFCPFPMRIDGKSVVAPVYQAKVQPEVEGVINKVLVREGDHVEAGQVIAEMNAWEYQASFAQAQASYRNAQLQMNRALASNNGTEAGLQHVQADYWKAEVERTRELVERTQLRSPIKGTVTTPHVENFVGRKLELGDSFAEVVDVSQVIVNVAVDDADAAFLKPGQPAVLKMNSNALRTFPGSVVVVSPSGETQAGTTVFYARVAVQNDDQSLRTGMEGRGKVSVGWHPSGYVFFRRPAIWLYSHVWSWVGW